jgi:exodeoxyribonuclease V alpha subunit
MFFIMLCLFLKLKLITPFLSHHFLKKMDNSLYSVISNSYDDECCQFTPQSSNSQFINQKINTKQTHTCNANDMYAFVNALPQDKEYVEIVGKVLKIKPYVSGKPVEFVVHTFGNKKNSNGQNSNGQNSDGQKFDKQDYVCTYDKFCPIAEGDAIHALCVVEKRIMGEILLKIVKPPFVQISMDRDSIVCCFLRVLRGTGFGNVKANGLFDIFERQANSETGVTAFVSELATQWLTSRDDALFLPYSSVISPKQMQRLLIWWQNKRSLRRLYLLGITKTEIRESGLSADALYKKLIDNPFPVVNLSLSKCEEILVRLNKVPTADDYRCAEISRKLYSNLINASWTGTPTEIMLNLYADFQFQWSKLQADYSIIEDIGTVYLKQAHAAESYVAEWIRFLMSEPLLDSKMSTEDPVFYCKTLTEEQKTAIFGALSHNVTIILGSAGTGKTTTIREIVNNLELREIPYEVLAPTGKAVSRIREVTRKRTPMTIHRRIGLSADPKKLFRHVIIDESSMVALDLIYQFLQKYRHPYKLTLVGDTNQLPPIGWGAFYEQLIKSKKVPVFRLSQNHRLDKIDGLDNGIMINSNHLLEYIKQYDIDRSKLIPFEYVETPNFSIIDGNIDLIFDIVRIFYEKGVPSSQITIITPYNTNLDELNKTCQQIFNEEKRYVIDNRGKCWMIGDRVICLVNSYSINVMNGEEGVVTNVDNEEIEVLFQESCVYKFKLEKTNKDNLNEDLLNDNDSFDEDITVMMLAHSYALTVHKSQGSEWNYVIIYIPDHKSNENFLNRNLIYTALTRAKRAVWVIGDRRSFERGSIKALPTRYENLWYRLHASSSQKSVQFA